MKGMKFIAAGFANDAEKLLLEFIKENSTEFSVFADKWKALNFAAVYLGRQQVELQQFTQEIFQITLKYLKSVSFYRRVGTIYLLYALFRNQILDPPIRIRVTLEQFKAFLEFQDIAEINDYKTLHYVIDFMIKNAFDFVANGFLFGPKTSKFQKEQESETEFILNDFRGEINEIIDSSILKGVTDCSEFYKKLKDKFQDLKWTEGIDFEAKMQALYNILNDEPNKNTSEENSNEMNFPTEETEDIGVRRAKLKAASFSQRALFRQLNPNDPEDEEEPDRLIICPSVPKRKRKKRVPKEERRKGRPPKAKNLKKEVIVGSGDEAKSVQNVYNRRPGPISRTSYLDYYDDSTIMNANRIQSVSPELSSTDED
ncbi:snRNA-activating protein complex subunit 1 [Trichonephila clavipes]|nr:snRNA-activating protein complex subunit 1 [Trichonephila clavipes]